MSVKRTLAAALLLSMAFAVGVDAQQTQFGKNKVQYQKFKWFFIQTDHFDIYFTADGSYLSGFTAAAAESAYTSISRSFKYQTVTRIPLIVYNSHNEFQQTNVIDQYMEEGIGGVTELFKNRVVVPFEGDYKKFRHVIHHELVHAVMNDMFYGGSIQSIISNNISLQLPMWISEGLAEYEALGWDTNSDMFMRDATVHESLVPINQLNGYFAYRGGQSVFWYISRKYGEQKVGELLNRIKSTRSVESGLRGALGIGIEELSERWQKDQKVLYWPDIAKREEPDDYARRLTDHKKEGSFYNTSPAISPRGDKIAFLTNRNDVFELYVMNAADGTGLERIARGETTNNFEELHLLTPGISWSPDGKKLVVATKAGDSDALIVIDVDSGDQDRLALGLGGIYSVVWSPDGAQLAFTGNTAKQSDIYIYDLKTANLTNLTNDLFSDALPSWSPDGSRLYFSSDRGNLLSGEGITRHTFPYSQADLYVIDIETRKVERVVDWPNSDETSSVVSPDGKKVLFLSDRNGIENMYEVTLETRKIRPITNSISGVYQLSLSRDGSKLAFSSLHKSGFDIFLMRNPWDRTLKVDDLEPTDYFKMLSPQAKPAAAPDVAAVPEQAPAAQDTSQLYGQGIQLDFSQVVFSDQQRNENVPRDSAIAALPKIKDNVAEDGSYKVNRYKLNFSPDLVYGNAGYDTFYGVTGSTIMAFSDLMGDHQIVFSTNLQLDLKNSDYGLQYFYLANMVDWGVAGYHSARFVIVNDVFGGSLYRFRTYGASMMVFYPLDRFHRLEFGLNWMNISKENLDRLNYPMQTRVVVLPSLAYTHDTSIWGFLNPVSGTRYRLEMYGTPTVGRDGLEFLNVGLDYRTYLRMGHYYSFAIRFAGGASFGTNPQKFIVGGVDSWINRTFEGGYVPLENAEDYIFLSTGVPLRGYNYNARIGSRYGLMNLELRYPLFAFLQAGPLPIGLQSLGGVMFFDMGSAWTHDRSFRAFTRTPSGSTVTQDLLMGMGTGARIYFLAFLLRLDVAWAWNAQNFSPPKYYFSLGLDF
jgi:Tol biopolymer transport system component